MSEGLIKMWVALAAIGLMFISVFSITFSRMKLSGPLRYIVTIFAYTCMITAGLLLLFVVFSGPVPK